MPAPDLRINGEFKTLDINNTCRYLGYLGYWGTRNGDMSATREVVRENARVARDVIKSHSLTPELSAKLFAQKRIGAFQFSEALIEWSQNELEGLQKNPGTSVLKRMVRTMVKHKLSIHLPNCRGWPCVPAAVRSAHTGLAAAR